MIKKQRVLVLGSGPIRIGQAAEFDYSGSQACRAIREEGCEVILLNSNPATIQTDTSLADAVYIRPLQPDVIESILAAHSPDSVIATLGGQVALNLAVELDRSGVWSRYGVKVLGTSPDSVQMAEGREDFRQLMLRIGEPVIESAYIQDINGAEKFASSSEYPFVIRPDFTLGGSGGGVVRKSAELAQAVETGLRTSPVSRVLIERYLEGWHEVELEVVRDGEGNRLCVCGMENFDPMGVHTGDSIVVAPVLTLTDRQWQKLRNAAFRIVDALDVKGACNVQFAVSPDAADYAVIEVNPRASRSSALASKATGYPIARMAAKIAMGGKLTEMPNPVTGTGSALSEPALDYVVVKFPRWPFEKFPTAETLIGTRMKSTGEVMALGRSFPEALLKAVRSLDLPFHSTDPDLREAGPDILWKETEFPTHRRIWCMLELFRRGARKEEIASRSGIHPFYVDQVRVIADILSEVSSGPLSTDLLLRSKTAGISDLDLAYAMKTGEDDLRETRIEKHIKQGYREVDGCAGESPAGSGYIYGSYGVSDDETPTTGKGSVVVLGSGPVRIGQGVEFDYCCVKAVEALRRAGRKAVMINNNPETVSTDHDMSDALYFEPLTVEDTLPVIQRENAVGVFSSFGGQTSLKLGQDLERRGVRLLGTPSSSINMAEDRGGFARLLDELGIAQPPGGAVTDVETGMALATKTGYPLMVRPSFVIGGLAMQVVTEPSELRRVLETALKAEPGRSVLIDRFLPGQEFEVDALCDGEDVLIPGIFEHLDPAGVHSGDSVALFPEISMGADLREQLVRTTAAIATALEVKGLLNIQFVLSGGKLYVIEANPRASRTAPIVSKLTGIPMVELAVRIALGESLGSLGGGRGLVDHKGPFGVKAPVFSTGKLPGVDSLPGPRMQSTGEALGIGDSIAEALVESFRGAGWNIPRRGTMLISVADSAKPAAAPMAALYNATGWKIEATAGTAAYLAKWGVKASLRGREDELLDAVGGGAWDLVVNIASGNPGALRFGYRMRRAAMEADVPCIHNLQVAAALGMALAGEAASSPVKPGNV